MAWIEVHQELRMHPKVQRLAQLLKISRAEATGYVINLWLWCSMYAKDGNVSDWSSDEVSMACDASQNGLLLKSLIETGFIDEKNGKKVVHDWKKYGLRFLRQQRERKRKWLKSRQLEKGEGTLPERSSNVITVPYRTVPNLTVPKDRVRTRPTEDELKEYIKTINGSDSDASECFDYYSGNGWVQGKARAPVKDWRAVARNWMRRKKAFTQEKPEVDWDKFLKGQ